MGYCRFENTFGDLKDCYEALENMSSIDEFIDEASEYEGPYVRKLISLCKLIADEYGHELRSCDSADD